jgi:hypothetical protein
VSTVNGASAVLPVDFDDDGDTDVASAAREGRRGWYENTDGARRFTARGLGHGDGASSVAAADIDGDGDLDLASASFEGDTIAFTRTRTAWATWLKRVVSTGADGAMAVVADDLADGDVDLAHRQRRLADLEASTGPGLPDRAHDHDRRRRRCGWPSRTSTATDGDLLAASSSTTRWPGIKRGRGCALFRGETRSPAWSTARGVAAADLDGDGTSTRFRRVRQRRSPGWNVDGLGASWAAETISAVADGALGVARATSTATTTSTRSRPPSRATPLPGTLARPATSRRRRPEVGRARSRRTAPTRSTPRARAC